MMVTTRIVRIKRAAQTNADNNGNQRVTLFLCSRNETGMFLVMLILTNADHDWRLPS